MKTVRTNIDFFYISTHYKPGDAVIVPDEIAADMIRLGQAEDAPDAAAVNADANPLHDAVDPLVPDADPLHAARALSMKTDQHPGLVALQEATDRPKQGRVKPTEVVKPSDVQAAPAPAPAHAPAPAPVAPKPAPAPAAKVDTKPGTPS